MAWSQIGKYRETKLLAGILPRHGVNYITGPHGAGKTASIADLVVALAAGDAGCGLGPTPGGMLQSLNGWFGRNVGAPSRIAVACPLEELDATRAAIEACALARGVTGPLPIVLWGVRGDFAAAIGDNSIRWRDAAIDLGGKLDMAVVTGSSFGPPDRHRAFARALDVATHATSCPVLVSVPDLPADQAASAEVILETTSDSAGGVLTLAKGEGAEWSRKFSFERISIGGVETRVVKAGALTSTKPIYTAPAPAPEPIPEPEVPIVGRFVYPLMAGDPSDAEKARWPGYGWISTPAEAIAAVEGFMNLGRTEILVALDHRGGTARADVARVQTVLQSAGLAEFAVVIESEKHILPPY